MKKFIIVLAVAAGMVSCGYKSPTQEVADSAAVAVDSIIIDSIPADSVVVL